jgi:transcription antitermination factor NusG
LKKSLRKWSDRKKWVDLPLIPGYCFVKIDFRFYLSVLQTQHVVAFVKFEGKPAIIRENQIDFLKRMLKQTDYTWEITKEKLVPGQKVEIVAGPFIGMEAELIALKGKKRVGVRIDQIHNTLLVDIPMEDVTVIS